MGRQLISLAAWWCTLVCMLTYQVLSIFADAEPLQLWRQLSFCAATAAAAAAAAAISRAALGCSSPRL